VVLVVMVSYYQKNTTSCQAAAPNQGHGNKNALNQGKIGQARKRYGELRNEAGDVNDAQSGYQIHN
jgi:hypothetical protein